MAVQVFISERAERNLKDIISYLEKEWSSRVSQKYLDILEKKIKLISENPNLYQAAAINKSIYRCVLTRQSVMYYRLVDNRIEIITIQDSRRDLKNI